MVAAWLDHESVLVLFVVLKRLPGILVSLSKVLYSHVSLLPCTCLLLTHEPLRQLSDINRLVLVCLRLMGVHEVVYNLSSTCVWCLDLLESRTLAGIWGLVGLLPNRCLVSVACVRYLAISSTWEEPFSTELLLSLVEGIVPVLNWV